MPNFLLSPNMNLPVPVVGVDPGPDWASNVNSCMSLIDSHDHSAGNGVQITPAGMNITTDLPMNGNDLTLIRSSRYQSQVSPLAATAPDLNCLYVSGVDLYYNDGNSNQVRITQSGGVAGSPGSIANLTAPASASYVSGNDTFVWQSDASTSANMDCGSVIIRQVLASANGITLSSPTSLASSYTLTLPTGLPAGTRFLSLDNSGAMAASWQVDNVTTAISTNQLIVKDNGISTTKILDAAVTQPKLYVRTLGTTAGSVYRSSSSGAFSTTSTTEVSVTNLSLNVTCTGRVTMVMLVPDTSIAGSYIRSAGTGGRVNLRRGASIIQYCSPGTSSENNIIFIDNPSAGVQSYAISVLNSSGSLIEINNIMLVIYEIN